MRFLIAAIAMTVVILRLTAVVAPRVVPQVPHVDTLRVMTTVYDTVTVVSRAADTIIVKRVGPLTEHDLVRMICSGLPDADLKESFEYNLYGMVLCPKVEASK